MNYKDWIWSATVLMTMAITASWTQLDWPIPNPLTLAAGLAILGIATIGFSALSFLMVRRTKLRRRAFPTSGPIENRRAWGT